MTKTTLLMAALASAAGACTNQACRTHHLLRPLPPRPHRRRPHPNTIADNAEELLAAYTICDGHQTSLLGLFATYELAVPDNPWLGTVDGFDTPQNACTAGVETEIANAMLYKAARVGPGEFGYSRGLMDKPRRRPPPGGVPPRRRLARRSNGPR
jgi:hypothetical protein